MVELKIKELEDILNSDIILSQDEINSKLLSIEKHILKLDSKYNSILNMDFNNNNNDNNDNNDSSDDMKSIKNKIDMVGDKVNSLINSNKNLEDIINSYAEFKKELSKLEYCNNEFTDIDVEYL